MRRFNSQIGLTLRITPKGGATTTVLGGDISRFDLHLTSYGWSGAFEFNVYDDQFAGGNEQDKLLADFTQPKLLLVELDVKAFRADVPTLRDPITLKAIVTKRSLRELPVDTLPIAQQVTIRRYRIEVADAARVLWGQHHPCKLYADKTMEEVIKDQLSPLIQFDDKWTWADKKPYKTPIVFFALDRSIGPSSFYDFLIWWIDRHRLIFKYDCTQDKYSIVEQKEDTGETFPIRKADVAERQKELAAKELPGQGVNDLDSYYEVHGPGVTIDYPEIPRYQPNILDSFTGTTFAKVAIPNEFADDKTSSDTLLRVAVQTEIDERADLERARLVNQPNPELTVVFRRFPAMPVFPGDLAQFKSGPGQWSADSWQAKQSNFRVFEVHLGGIAVNQVPDSAHQNAANYFHTSYTARLELKSDITTPRLPSFVAPTYPVHVEGKILSDIGAANDQTYGPKQLDTGLFHYRVQVPLWADSAPEIAVPYNPGRMPGQMFFPAYKNERVLLALTWKKAWIDGFLDWRDDVRIPADSQGNRLLLGKSTTSRTSLLNYYENESSLRPIFEIARTHNNDLQTIRISEGNLRIEVKEDAAGSAVKVENVDETKQY
jgi:hypothetical protein